MVETRNGAPPTAAPHRAESLEALASRAASGDRDALEQVCKELRDPIFRLALRFFSEPADAEDSTQEILLQVITHLGTFEGRSKLTTWVYRIASRHLLRTKRRGAEPTVHSAAEIAEYLDASLAPTPYTAADDAEYRMLRDESARAAPMGCSSGSLGASGWPTSWATFWR